MIFDNNIKKHLTNIHVQYWENTYLGKLSNKGISA